MNIILIAIAIHANDTNGLNLSPIRANFHGKPRIPVLCESSHFGAYACIYVHRHIPNNNTVNSDWKLNNALYNTVQYRT